MKTIGLILTFAISFLTKIYASGDNTQTIRGTVRNGATGFPLTGAYVIVRDSKSVIGSATDNNGRNELKNVPLGRQALRITYVGYEPKTVSNLMLISGKELIAEIAIEVSNI